MTVRLLDLRPLTVVHSAEKRERPVSIVLLPDETPLVVSRFGDNVWDFYPYIPQRKSLRPAQKLIDWNITAQRDTVDRPGECCIAGIIEGFHLVAVCDAICREQTSRIYLSHLRVTALRPLLYWMVANGLSRLQIWTDGRSTMFRSPSRGKSGKPASPATWPVIPG